MKQEPATPTHPPEAKARAGALQAVEARKRFAAQIGELPFDPKSISGTLAIWLTVIAVATFGGNCYLLFCNRPWLMEHEVLSCVSAAIMLIAAIAATKLHTIANEEYISGKHCEHLSRSGIVTEDAKSK